MTEIKWKLIISASQLLQQNFNIKEYLGHFCYVEQLYQLILKGKEKVISQSIPFRRVRIASPKIPCLTVVKSATHFNRGPGEQVI